jgi:Protein of unknown function (DUF3309)
VPGDGLLDGNYEQDGRRGRLGEGHGVARVPVAASPRMRNHFPLEGFLTSDWTGQGNLLRPQALNKSPARGTFVLPTIEGGKLAVMTLGTILLIILVLLLIGALPNWGYGGVWRSLGRRPFSG